MDSPIVGPDNEGIDRHARVYNLPGADFRFYPQLLSRELADFYFESFRELPFASGKVRGGSERRMSCFFSDLRNADGILRNYQYSGKDNPALPFPPEMRAIKNTIEAVTGNKFNACWVNLYPDGKSVIGFHSDKETSLVPGSMIASISLGAERWFDIRAKDGSPDPEVDISIRTHHGSLMTMGGMMQTYYKHQIRAEAAVKTPRINLTFRLAK